MSKTIFAQVLETHPFTAFPTEYTDRYTPEVARQEGYKQGAADTYASIIATMRKVKAPTRQLQALLAEVEEAESQLS